MKREAVDTISSSPAAEALHESPHESNMISGPLPLLPFPNASNASNLGYVSSTTQTSTPLVSESLMQQIYGEIPLQYYLQAFDAALPDRVCFDPVEEVRPFLCDYEAVGVVVSVV